MNEEQLIDFIHNIKQSLKLDSEISENEVKKFVKNYHMKSHFNK